MIQHPDVQRPWSDWSEQQTLHIAAVFFNPFRWQSRRLLFNDFRRHMEATPNVKLHVVELAFGDRPHEVTTDADLQLRTPDELWAKENLINICVQRSFPKDWQYGGYWDGDFHATRQDWALEAVHMLQHHEFVQLFSSYADLTPETPTSDTGHRPYAINSTFAWNYVHQEQFMARKQQPSRGKGHGKKCCCCFCPKPDPCDPYYGLPIPKPMGSFPFGFTPGATGGAWAWRRSAFDTVGGMLDTCIVGGADWHMAFGLVGTVVKEREMLVGEPYTRSLRQWQRRAMKLTANIGCVDNFALHHYHGSKEARSYANRWRILERHKFDPASDLTRDWQGVWRWTGDKPRLRDDLRRYFIARCEDRTDCSARLV